MKRSVLRIVFWFQNRMGTREWGDEKTAQPLDLLVLSCYSFWPLHVCVCERERETARTRDFSLSLLCACTTFPEGGSLF